MSDKYLVIRVEDVQRYLPPEWQTALQQAVSAINQGRESEGKRTNHAFFVLSLGDEFAREAIKAYVRAAQAHPKFTEDAGIRAASAKAMDLLTTGSLQSVAKTPD